MSNDRKQPDEIHSSISQTDGGLNNIIIPVERDIHKKIRIYCIEKEISLKDFGYDTIIEKVKKLKML